MLMNKNKTINNLKTLLFALIIAVFIRTFLFSTTYVSGQSMAPTLSDRDYLIVQKLGISPFYIDSIGHLDHGDIVIFKNSFDRRLFIKRVIGLPGDRVEIHHGKVYLNGLELEEDYIHQAVSTEALNLEGGHIVPEAHVFVIGDNRFPGESFDSRQLGDIPISQIKGKVDLRLFPLSKLGKIHKAQTY